MLKIGEQIQLEIFKGSSRVNKIYKGSQLVYESGIWTDADSDVNLLTLTDCVQRKLKELTVTGDSVQEPTINVRSVEGAAVMVDDCSGGNIRNIKQYGQSEQNGTPTPEAPIPITGKAAGGTVYGKNLCPIADGRVRPNYGVETICAIQDNLYGKTVAFSAKVTAVEASCRIRVKCDSTGGSTYLYGGYIPADQTGISSGSGVIPAGTTAILVQIQTTTITASATATEIQLELGSTATVYEPYVAPTDYTVTDANGDPVTLYGIPVTSGGNVTIDGQQYVSDYIQDGVCHRLIGKKIFDGTEVFVDYVQRYDSITVLLSHSNDCGICTHGEFGYHKNYSWSNNAYINFNASGLGVSTIEELRTMLSAQNSAGTPITIYYALAEETTFPVTISSVNAVAPTTTWLSDCHSSMELAVTGQGNITLPTPNWPVPIKNVGNTIICNQLIDKSTFVPTKTEYGITFTSNGDGSITANGTATTGWANFTLKTDFTFLEGHKYLFAGVEDTADYIQFYLYGDEGYPNNAVCNGIFTIPSEWVISEVCLKVMQGTVLENAVYKPQIFDLTDMFGAGNEPATVAEFRGIFPDDYYEYDAGSTKYAVPVKVSGKNLLDSNSLAFGVYSQETGLPIIGIGGQKRSTYAINCSGNECFIQSNASHFNVRAYWYDNNENFISSSLLYCNVAAISPDNARYMRFNTGTAFDDNTQIERGNAVTPYEPYHEPITKVLYLDEPLRAGDTLEVVDGKLIKRRNSIDMGSMELVYDSSNKRFYADNPLQVLSIVRSSNYLCDKYVASTNGTDKSFFGYSHYVYFYDSRYIDAISFKSDMSGVMIEYELATPIEIDISGQDIPTFEGTTIVTVETETQPANIATTYYKKA